MATEPGTDKVDAQPQPTQPPQPVFSQLAVGFQPTAPPEPSPQPPTTEPKPVQYTSAQIPLDQRTAIAKVAQDMGLTQGQAADILWKQAKGEVHNRTVGEILTEAKTVSDAVQTSPMGGGALTDPLDQYINFGFKQMYMKQIMDTMKGTGSDNMSGMQDMFMMKMMTAPDPMLMAMIMREPPQQGGGQDDRLYKMMERMAQDNQAMINNMYQSKFQEGIQGQQYAMSQAQQQFFEQTNTNYGNVIGGMTEYMASLSSQLANLKAGGGGTEELNNAVATLTSWAGAIGSMKEAFTDVGTKYFGLQPGQAGAIAGQVDQDYNEAKTNLIKEIGNILGNIANKGVQYGVNAVGGSMQPPPPPRSLMPGAPMPPGNPVPPASPIPPDAPMPPGNPLSQLPQPPQANPAPPPQQPYIPNLPNQFQPQFQPPMAGSPMSQYQAPGNTFPTHTPLRTEELTDEEIMQDFAPIPAMRAQPAPVPTPQVPPQAPPQYPAQPPMPQQPTQPPFHPFPRPPGAPQETPSPPPPQPPPSQPPGTEPKDMVGLGSFKPEQPPESDTQPSIPDAKSQPTGEEE